jgi:hypothetical protein
LRDKLGKEEIKYILTSAPKVEGFYEKLDLKEQIALL